MARIGAWLAAGALLLVVAPVRPAERLEAVPVEAAPAVGSHPVRCSAGKCGHQRLQHIYQWLTYRSADRPGLCGCCRQCPSCCIPPLDTFFLCDAKAGGAAHHVVARPAHESEPPCCKHRWLPWPRKCGCDQ